MVSTSGSQLLREDAVKTLIRQLLPLTTVLTPNVPEAKLILKTAGVSLCEPENVEDVISIAKAIQRLGPKYVLLKGGHLPLTADHRVTKSDADKKLIVNILCGKDSKTNEEVLEIIESPYQDSRNTHGTGDSLACTSPVY